MLQSNLCTCCFVKAGSLKAVWHCSGTCLGLQGITVRVLSSILAFLYMPGRSGQAGGCEAGSHRPLSSLPGNPESILLPDSTVACCRRKPPWKAGPSSKLSLSKLQTMTNDRRRLACNSWWLRLLGMRKNTFLRHEGE